MKLKDRVILFTFLVEKHFRQGASYEQRNGSVRRAAQLAVVINCSTITGFPALQYLWTSFGQIYWIIHFLMMVCTVYLPGTYDPGLDTCPLPIPTFKRFASPLF